MGDNELTAGGETEGTAQDTVLLSELTNLTGQYVEDVVFVNDVRIVTSQAEFNAAYSAIAAGGGGVIKLATSGGPYVLSRYDYLDTRENAPIAITSLTPDDPAVLSSVYLREEENVHMTDLRIESASGALWSMISVENSGLYNSELLSDARGSAGVVTEEGGAEIGASVGDIRWSDGITFVGNHASNFNQGLTIRDSSNMTVALNEFEQFQSDGIRLGGVQDMLIAENHFHDPLGSTHSYNHDDFIQFWGTNIGQNNARVTIRSNIFDNTSGPAYQVIFGHNEDFEENGWLFEDIVVENNVIWGGAYHGISLSDVLNAQVTNNTLIHIDESYMILADGRRDPLNGPGWIDIEGTGAVVEKNVAANIGNVGDNIELSYGGSSDAMDQANQYLNLSAAGSGALRDIMLLPDSQLNGVYGSSLLWYKDTSDALTAVARVIRSVADKSVVTLDAGLSRDETGLLGDNARYIWTLDDGRVFEGRSVTVDFETAGTHGYALSVVAGDGTADSIERELRIDPADLLDLDVVNGALVDSAGSKVLNLDAVTLEGDGFRIGSGAQVGISRDTAAIYNLGAFDISMTLDLDPGSSGTLFMIHKSMSAKIDASGALSFGFKTNETSFRVATDPGLFDNGPVYLSFVYDGSTLSILANGQVVAETAAWGNTLPLEYWGLTFGNPWNATVSGVLSDVTMRSEAVGVTVPGKMLAQLEVQAVVPAPEAANPGQIYLDVDFSTADVDGINIPASDIVTLANGDAGVMAAQSAVVIERSAGLLYEVDNFEVTVSVQHLDTSTAGTILFLNEALHLKIDNDGHLRLVLTTDEGGKRVVATQGAPLADGALHDIAIGYDSDSGIMRIAVDGEILAVAEQTGLTPPEVHWGMSIGHPWSGAEPDMFVSGLRITDFPTQMPAELAVPDNDTIVAGQATPPAQDLDDPTAPIVDTLVFVDFDGEVINEGNGSAVAEIIGDNPGYVVRGTENIAAFSDRMQIDVSPGIESASLSSGDSFEFVIEMRDRSNTNTETVFSVDEQMSLEVRDGDFHFMLEAAGARFWLSSAGNVLSDGAFHEVRLGYDGAGGRLAMMVDGVIVSEVAACGTSAILEIEALTIGAIGEAGLEADINSFALNTAADWV